MDVVEALGEQLDHYGDKRAFRPVQDLGGVAEPGQALKGPSRPLELGQSRDVSVCDLSDRCAAIDS
jgi:hypothetical protein